DSPSGRRAGRSAPAATRRGRAGRFPTDPASPPRDTGRGGGSLGTASGRRTVSDVPRCPLGQCSAEPRLQPGNPRHSPQAIPTDRAAASELEPLQVVAAPPARGERLGRLIVLDARAAAPGLVSP